LERPITQIIQSFLEWDSQGDQEEKEDDDGDSSDDSSKRSKKKKTTKEKLWNGKFGEESKTYVLSFGFTTFFSLLLHCPSRIGA
jgi:hypothetical protein